MTLDAKKVREGLVTLTKAAVNGDVNALTPAIQDARQKELKIIMNNSPLGADRDPTAEELKQANESVVKNWLQREINNMASGKGAAAEKIDKVGLFKSFMSNDYMGIFTALAADKIDAFVSAIMDMWENRGDKNKFGNPMDYFEKHKQERNVALFAERLGLNEAAFREQIENPSQKTVDYAKMTPEEQAKRVEDGIKARQEGLAVAKKNNVKIPPAAQTEQDDTPEPGEIPGKKGTAKKR